METPKAVNLDDEIVFHREPVGANEQDFFIQNKSIYSVELKLDLTGSRNVEIVDVYGFVVEAKLHPQSKTKLCRIRTGANWSMQRAFSFARSHEAASGAARKSVNEAEQTLMEEIARSRTALGKTVVQLKSPT
jgi:hypothetical protein